MLDSIDEEFGAGRRQLLKSALITAFGAGLPLTSEAAARGGAPGSGAARAAGGGQAK
jgi:hypothetical protein